MAGTAMASRVVRSLLTAFCNSKDSRITASRAFVLVHIRNIFEFLKNRSSLEKPQPPTMLGNKSLF